MKTLLIIGFGIAPLLLSGCNTMKGVGQDITGSATYVQEKMSGDNSATSSDSQYVKNPPEFPKSN